MNGQTATNNDTLYYFENVKFTRREAFYNNRAQACVCELKLAQIFESKKQSPKKKKKNG